VRASALKQRHNDVDTVRIGLFNSRSLAGKSANIQQWISDNKLSIAALTETWHDAASPDLIACAPAGFKFVEKARARTNELSILTNHGGVCLFHSSTLRERAIQLPTCATFEVVAAYVHRAGFNAVVVVVYRPGYDNATQSFFDELDSLLERLSTYSAPVVIVGDFNIHVDVTSDTVRASCASYCQHTVYCSMSGLRRTATVIHSTC